MKTQTRYDVVELTSGDKPMHTTNSPVEALKWIKHNIGTNTGMIEHSTETKDSFENWLVPVNARRIMVVKH